ncbi:metal ABC transporter permease, partial [Aerococcus mictus]
VAAFNAAGAILVIALMVVPAATAILFARSLRHLLVLTLLIAVAEALLGFVLALYLDLATSAMMAFTDGVVFLSALAWYKLSGRAAARSHRRTLSVPAAAAGAAAS